MLLPARETLWYTLTWIAVCVVWTKCYTLLLKCKSCTRCNDVCYLLHTPNIYRYVNLQLFALWEHLFLSGYYNDIHRMS